MKAIEKIATALWAFLGASTMVILLVGCSPREATTSYDKADYPFIQFISLGRAKTRGLVYSYVFVDANTDVLYFAGDGVGHSICPIMKADGTCLTFTEWREKNGFAKNTFLEDVPFPEKKETKPKEMGARECLELALDPDRTPHHWINPNDLTDHYCERCGLHIYKEEGGGTTINRTDFNRDVRYCHK